jgi:hypothetical protein
MANLQTNGEAKYDIHQSAFFESYYVEAGIKEN